MHFKPLTLDLQTLRTKSDLLDALRHTFKYTPDFPGNNLDACIDIISSLRYPEDGMTRLHLKPKETVLLTVAHANEASPEITHTLLVLVASINNRSAEMGDAPLIYLLMQD